MDGYHKSVLVKEILGYLKVKKDKWYLDCTLGDGGHSLEILRLGGKVVGLDQDPQALARARARLLGEGVVRNQFKLVEANFGDLGQVLEQEGVNFNFFGVVFDLGVSSLQFEDQNRGFSFLKEAELDMRMSPNLSVRASDLVNGLNQGELIQVLEKFGEEPEFLAKKIAAEIIKSRPIQTTSQLRMVVERVKRRSDGIHPATLTFQALRIAVNDELSQLENGLPKALEVLETGSRLEVISFHSLEDRIIKNLFKSWENGGKGQIITDKPVMASEEEVKQNNRARSAKLRVFQKDEKI